MDEKILTLLTEMKSEITEMKSEMNARFAEINKRLSNLEEEVSEIKEDTEITRTAVNTLIEWADAVSEVEAVVKFPVKKSS
ncbi:MAG: hypothetical protein IJP18_04305 [Oscillospiraceae bacterium]|nr:hypothetical protein [Oscillospiraceae bacterium]